jgi:hypothetical protein
MSQQDRHTDGSQTNNNQQGDILGNIIQARDIGRVDINSQGQAREHWPVDDKALHSPDLFVARTDELDLLDTVGGSRDDSAPPGVVIVCGPPGVGKTALAARWAGDPARSVVYPDGFIELKMDGYSGAPPVREQGALQQLLKHLNSESPPPQDPHAAAIEFRRILADRDAIILFDDVADAAFIRDLLPARGGTLVIVTSRGGLPDLVKDDHVRPVTNLRLTTMEPTDALGLLRIALGKAGDFDEESARVVVNYACGLPIALRIAARVVKNDRRMTLATLAHELQARRVGLKVFDTRVSVEGKLEKIFGTSYEKLDADTRRLFRLLAEHVGRPVTAHSASLVVGTDLPTADGLLRVIANVGLIESDGPHYTMLDLARDYGRALAKSDDNETHRAVIDRLLDGYYLAVNHGFDTVNKRNPMVDTQALDSWPQRSDTSSHIGDDDAAVNQWMESQHLNLVALVHAGCAASPPHTGAARLAFSLFYLLERGGYWSSWAEITDCALEVARLTGDRRTYTLLLRNQARIGMVRLRNSTDSIHKDTDDDETTRAQARRDCGEVLRAFKRSLRLASRLRLGPEITTTIAREIADTKLLLARIAPSTAALRRTEKAYLAVEMKFSALPDNANPIASLSVQLSEVHRRQGRFDHAQKRLDIALSFSWPAGSDGTRTVRHASTCGYALVRQAELFIAQHAVDQAQDSLGSATGVFHAHGMSIPEARALALLAELRASSDDQRGAVTALERSHEILRDKSSPEAAVVRHRLDILRSSGPTPPASNGSDTW